MSCLQIIKEQEGVMKKILLATALTLAMSAGQSQALMITFDYQVPTDGSGKTSRYVNLITLQRPILRSKHLMPQNYLTALTHYPLTQLRDG